MGVPGTLRRRRLRGAGRGQELHVGVTTILVEKYCLFTHILGVLLMEGPWTPHPVGLGHMRRPHPQEAE
ncbi:hypothetical protein NDU88_007509 [Pleurodeles waltl]|uniref:Uncharacterized protein n=1 Tax=Pleurodeles waltl TaxID=8319 RepID=A0AAV7SSQ6_PLEWA|nr:hypothetical protein NDU88_007509 [Pleurodeles waltl]